MRSALALLFVLALSATARAQAPPSSRPWGPGWGSDRALPTPPWDDGDEYPHMSWPGYCAPPPLHPADIPESTRTCTIQTFIPPFSVDGGISFKFPGEPGYQPNEIQQRRDLMINQAWGVNTGVMPTAPHWIVHPNAEPGETFPPFGDNRQPAGSKCANTPALTGNPRLVAQGYCDPETGENGPPPFNNLSERVDNLTLTQSGAGNFPSGTVGNNIQWWVYYPERDSNHRVLIVVMGTFGNCNWTLIGNQAGSRPLMARALNEGFAVVMATGVSCSGGSPVSSNLSFGPVWHPFNAFINYYNAQPDKFEDYNIVGSSLGGWYTNYCALDPRIKVTYGDAGGGNNNTFYWSSGARIQGPTENISQFTIAAPTSRDAWPAWFSLVGQIDNLVMCADGSAGARLVDAGIYSDDEYFNDGRFNNVVNLNPAAFNGKPRCGNHDPCNWTWFNQEVTRLGKHTNGLIAPENYGGTHRYIGGVNNPEGWGHQMGRRARRDLFTDLWQVGPQGRGRMHGGVH